MSVIAFKKQFLRAPQPAEDEAPEAEQPVVAIPLADDEGAERGFGPLITAGSVIFGVCILGTGLWMALAPLSGAVMAPAVVKVEDSRKVVKNRDGGIVAQVLVRDGQHVGQGDVLLRMDDVQARSAFEVYDNQLLNLSAKRARFAAESKGADRIEFPASVLDRQGDGKVEQLIAEQTLLFDTRRQALATQVQILEQRLQQLETRIGGYDAQVSSITRQQELIKDEEEGVNTLYKRGLAPKTQLLALQRASVDLEGRTGSLRSQIAEAREAQGEARMQMNKLRQDRQTEANQGLSEAQNELANIIPRLQAARSTLELTEVRAPVSGTILGLTQFTNGGVVGAGERILDIVPDDTRLVVEARVKPEDIDEIEPGMAVDVKLTAYMQSVTPSVAGTIRRISADRLTDEAGFSYFAAEIDVDPASLSRTTANLTLYPGMPAEIIVPTGERTALEYMLSPISNSMSRAFREQ
ncbi:MAG: HlyD family type I secretion periplasmic adaptor subunit [Mesorhizobium amorphae]|nr:MAG: HlyD family type I secretion periplasmic adaptor subunit [Mesorhizobium amorphae]